jgi:hypothetical protein
MNSPLQPATRLCARCRKSYEIIPTAVADKSYAPFCSKRCADIDMMHWIKGEYIISEGGALGLTEEEDAPVPPPALSDVDD